MSDSQTLDSTIDQTDSDGNALLHLSSIASAAAMIGAGILGMPAPECSLIANTSGHSFVTAPSDIDDPTRRALSWCTQYAVNELAGDARDYLQRTGDLSAAADVPDEVDMQDGINSVLCFDPSDASEIPPLDDEDFTNDFMPTFMRSMPAVQALALRLMLERSQGGPGTVSIAELSASGDDDESTDTDVDERDE